MRLTDLTDNEIEKCIVIRYRDNDGMEYSDISKKTQFKAIAIAIKNFNTIKSKINDFAKMFHSYSMFYRLPYTEYDKYVRNRNAIVFNVDEFKYSTTISEIDEIIVYITNEDICGVNYFLKVLPFNKDSTKTIYLNVKDNEVYFDATNFKYFILNEKIEWLVENTSEKPEIFIKNISEMLGFSKDEVVEKYKCAFLEKLKTI